MLVGITKSQAVINDIYWFGIDENGQPINNGEGDKVNVNTLKEFVTVYSAIIFFMSNH